MFSANYKSKLKNKLKSKLPNARGLVPSISSSSNRRTTTLSLTLSLPICFQWLSSLRPKVLLSLLNLSRSTFSRCPFVSAAALLHLNHCCCYVSNIASALSLSIMLLCLDCLHSIAPSQLLIFFMNMSKVFFFLFKKKC